MKRTIALVGTLICGLWLMAWSASKLGAAEPAHRKCYDVELTLSGVPAAKTWTGLTDVKVNGAVCEQAPQ